MTQIETDYSLRNAPASWNEAAEVAEVVHDPSPLGRRRVLPTMPTREQPDVVSGTIMGGIVALAGGWLWYRYEVDMLTQMAWIAPLLGVAIALAVRAAGGPSHSDVRATLSAVLYLMTVLSVAYMIERTQFSQAYGNSSQFFNSNTALLRNRISEPATLSYWLLGLIATIQISYLLGKRR